MKYKEGQKVILKNNLEYCGWDNEIILQYQKIPNPRIVTIKEVVALPNSTFGYYYLEEIECGWGDDELQNPKELIHNRFEILDL